MRLCTYLLQEHHVPPHHIRREVFDVKPLPRHILPPDTDTHLVHIRQGGKEHTLPVQYPQTILQAARAQGLSLPYSCNAGSCGQCAVRCLEGRVWMARNEVLTEADQQQGFVLTCTGYPAGGPVVLDFGTEGIK
jgi:ring-1,2-phenylacetyl-CoA epoxidase subunit PaaE